MWVLVRVYVYVCASAFDKVLCYTGSWLVIQWYDKAWVTITHSEIG